MINPIRHLAVFDPDSFGDRRIDIIGAGATGSRIALELAKLGVQNLHVWDFDTVESHNIPNQAFGVGDIGKLKVKALAEIILRDTGTTISTHNQRVDGSEEFGEVVFLLVDSMDTRREIWERGIRYNLGVKFLIETRMGTEQGRVYTLNPSDPNHIASWEKTLCTTVEAQPSACGTTPSVGPTAGLVAGFAVWQFMRWFQWEQGNTTDEIEGEIIFGLTPEVLIETRLF